MGDRIFVALSSFGDYGAAPLELLRESGIPFAVNPHGRRLSGDEIVSLAGEDVTGIVAGGESYDARILGNLSTLRCLSRCGLSLDNIDQGCTVRRGILVRNTPDVVTLPVAELTLGLIFSLLRQLTLHDRTMHGGQWGRRAGSQLAGKTVGILGLGRIGRRVAEMLRGLGVRVMGSDPSPDLAWAARAGVEVVPMEKLLREVDILSLHVSLDVDTPFRMDESYFEAMKEGAWLVNTSRGGIVDEAALFAALKSDKLAGAALDVFAQEPYSGPLSALENVILTPHVGTLTRESRMYMEVEAVQNLLDALRS